MTLDRAVSRFIFLLSLGVAISGGAEASVAHTATMVLEGKPGDYIVGDQKLSFNQATGTFTGSATAVGPGLPPNHVSIRYDEGFGGHTWSLDFAAPQGQALVPGVYLNATRYPFQDPSVPGESLYGDGRGCNEQYGKFTIFNIQVDCLGNLVALDAILDEQHCESPDAPPAKAEIHFRADPVSPLNLSISPTAVSILPGTSTLLSVSIGAAQESDLVVTLVSSNTEVLTVPGTVIVTAGSTEVSFQADGLQNGSATITASLPSDVCQTLATAVVTVNDNTVTLDPASIAIASGSVGTLTATMAKARDEVTTLSVRSSSSSVAATPDKVTIPAGEVSVSIPVVGGFPGTATVTVAFPQSLGGASAQAQVTVDASPVFMAPGTVSMPLGYVRTVQVFLQQASANDTLIPLSNSDPTVVSVPESVTIRAGFTSATFDLHPLRAGGPVTISASIPGVGTATCTVTVTVPIVILTQTDLSIPLGGRFALPAFLSAFPASDTTLEITSSDPSILQIEGPTSKTITVGNNHDTFLLHAVGVGGPVVVTISSPQLGPGATATVLVSVSSASEPCSGSATALCLSGSRFSVQVAWQSYFDGSSGVGTAVPLTGDSGYFWFFNDQNVELIVKVLDGRAVNNSFWVLYGALTDVSYTITVTDTVTGQSKTYYNPAHTLASVADVTAFPGVGRPAVRAGGELGRLASVATRDATRSAGTARASALPSRARSPLAACTSGPNDLCLNAERFSVSVSWRNYNDDETGAGQAVPLTGDSGYFWFFSSENVELVVKVLDGTATNGKFWVLYGALSDVEYTITITDTSTGTTKTYFNPAHTLASQADITAF